MKFTHAFSLKIQPNFPSFIFLTILYISLLSLFCLFNQLKTHFHFAFCLCCDSIGLLQIPKLPLPRSWIFFQRVFCPRIPSGSASKSKISHYPEPEFSSTGVFGSNFDLGLLQSLQIFIIYNPIAFKKVWFCCRVRRFFLWVYQMGLLGLLVLQFRVGGGSIRFVISNGRSRERLFVLAWLLRRTSEAMNPRPPNSM